MVASAVGVLGSAAGAASANADTVWVCKPGQADNVCRDSQRTTVYEPNGSSRVVDPRIPANPPRPGAPAQTLIPSQPFPPGFIAAGITFLYGGAQPTAPTPWLTPADRYTARCERSNGAHVLMVNPIGNARRLNPSPDASWGLHLVDGNIALGDLQRAVAGQSRADLGSRRKPRLAFRIRSRRGRDARGRRCARQPIRASLTGADRRAVRLADFRANRRLVKRDRRYPFSARIRRARLRGGRVVRFGVRAKLVDGRAVRGFRRVRVCR